MSGPAVLTRAATAGRHCECLLPLHRNPGGGVRFLVACSNAYASCSSFGSLHADPVNPTPYGCGFGSKPAGSAGGGSAAGAVPTGGGPPRPPFALPGTCLLYTS